MKIVVAPDKFKDSLTGIEFCRAVKEGIQKVLPNADIKFVPLADGGDETINVVNFYLGTSIVKCTVNDPLFREIEASYLFDKQERIAFIEMAEASGLKLLNEDERNCMLTTSLGTGEMIRDALNKGVKTIYLGIGGSATNDCGIGMASALGFRFLDHLGHEVKPVGKNLNNIYSIDKPNVDLRIKDTNFKVISDVSNPLYGENGAAFVYAKQKGASIEEIQILDKGLRVFSELLDKQFSVSSQQIIGGGAAGGLGVGGSIFLNAEIVSGIEFIKSLANFDDQIKGADWIITGEGKLDHQTLSGKVIHGVVESAKHENCKVAALCGKLELTPEALDAFGISYTDAILNKTNDVRVAMTKSFDFVREMATDFAKSITS